MGFVNDSLVNVDLIFGSTTTGHSVLIGLDSSSILRTKNNICPEGS